MSSNDRHGNDRPGEPADRQAWSAFESKLSAVQTFDEALRLAAQPPPRGTPGRPYYDNLSSFLGAFSIPRASTAPERTLYLELIRRLDAAGVLKPGAREMLEKEFRRVDREG